MPAPPEVMNIRQASQYLGISPDTLYRYVAEEKIPGFKLGNRWKFKKTTLDRWMEKQSLATRRRQMTREVAGKPEAAASVRDGSKRYAAARRLL
jgi:excisionase family DNA binding protein